MKEAVEAIELQVSKQNKKVAIIVLGMHRSGTSMLAGILDRLGCKGPKTQLEANEKNSKGFFESKPVFRLNDEIFTAGGTRWNDWQPLGEDWLRSPRFNEFRDRAVDVLKAEYGDASMIYLKDPRICRLLPLWQHALEEMGYRVVCIHTHRHPLDVATSLKARKSVEVEPSIGMLSWLRHALEAESLSRSLPRIFTSYANLIDDWQHTASLAEKTFAFTWPIVTRTGQQRVAELIDPNLRHHQSSIQAFLQDPLTPELYRDTLQIMENWVQNGENKADHVTLDGLRQDFDSSASLLFAPANALEVAARDIKVLNQYKTSGEAHQAEIKASAKSIADIQEKYNNLASQKEVLQAELEQALRDREEANTQVQAYETQIQALTARLTKAESCATELKTENTIWTERVIDRDKRIAKLQQAVDVKRQKPAATIKNELRDLKKQYMRAIEDLHKYYKNSTSWKITTPLRLIKRRIKKLR